MLMLELNGVNLSYGPVQALRGVSLTVRAGSITAIVGANGAGKSTALKAISGVVPIGSGTILLDGRPIQQMPSEERVRLGIAHVLEGRRLFGDQTVEKNLLLGAYTRLRRGGLKAEVAGDCDQMYRRFPILGERRLQQVTTLSGGEQQMLAIAVALMSRPRLLLLDEPSLGLAPKIVDQVADLVVSLKDEGLTVLLVEQMASMALSLGSEGYVFERGRVVAAGPAGQLLREMKLHEAYFGRGAAGRGGLS